jgi:putative membrane protein
VALVVTSFAAATAAPAQGTGGKSAAPVTDAHIAAIVVGANTIDVEYGRLAQARSRSEEVRRFAESMVTSHTGVNQQASELASRLRLTPEENATSRELAAAASAKRAELGRLTGAAFDRAYIANEIAFHETVLQAIDSVLLPNARNAELKALIAAVRPSIAGHLEYAKQVQSRLGS